MSGFVVWMTGLSGAGKSTLASLLTEELSLKGVHVECLDGDEVRKNLSHGLGFSREDRDRNVRRIGYVARMVARSGSCAITAAISPYRALRDEIRSKTENFLEVYCECPLDVLTERDPKGLYKRALAGEIKNFTGVDDPYEAPEEPEVRVRTDQSTPQECVAQIMVALEQRGLLVRSHGGASLLPPPFGGEVFEARPAVAEERKTAQPTVEVSEPVAQNLLAVASGLFSPVGGFMSEREATKVEKGSALEGGTPWWNVPFVLPLPEDIIVTQGEVLRLDREGAFLGLVRVDRVWTSGNERRVAGAIEAVSYEGRGGQTARQVRTRARTSGWTHFSALFSGGPPSGSSRGVVQTALQLTDGVVVAVTAHHANAWKAVLDETRTQLVVLPDDFPFSEERARMVVKKSLGATTELLLE